MNKLIKYVPLHFLFFLILGILCQYYYQVWTFGFKILFLLIFVFASFLLLLKKNILITLCAPLLFFFLGISSTYINNSKSYSANYQIFYKEKTKTTLQIAKVLKPGFYYEKYVATVIQIDSIKTVGSILLNVQKDSLKKRLQIDDVLLTTQNFKELIPPLNPNQFHYKNYLAKQGIYNQMFLNHQQFINMPKQTISLVGVSEKVRNHIQSSLLKYQFKKDEFAVISALLLGQRQDISKGLLTDYANAGAIHILAVSGLHVGVILWILSFLLTPLERLKNGKFLKAFCIILLLWMFAFIAGLSASVVRAVTMFTFVAFGQIFNRKNNVSFSLITSMLFLLLCKPMFLFDVGFQLSYLAVFGIIWVQPKLYTIYTPIFYLDKKIWQLLTVSIAAQVGILPLSIYYFQQFPGLFVLSNLVIIPFLGAILIGGILIITLALINTLPNFLAKFYGYIISIMNDFVSWISRQEDFLLKEISLSFFMMLASYFLIFSFVLLSMKQKPIKLIYFLVSIIIFQSIYFVEKNTNLKKEAFIVFHKSRYAVIGKRDAKKLYIQQDIDPINSKNISAIKSYRIKDNLEVLNIDFNNSIQFKNKQIVLVDSLGIYNLKGLEKPIVVLQYSPKINLVRLLKNIKPSEIIADGSNYKTYVTAWEKVCLKNNIPFHYTGQKGAYILND